MADPDRDLTTLAGAVADGATPDWTAQQAGAADEHTRAVVEQLQAIADIARLHGTLDDGTAARGADTGGLLEAPATWGSLRIIERVGSGKFGDVYRAFDPGLQREVALKLLREHGEVETEVIEEGRLAARVRHPNVVTIYGAQTIEGRTGLWMELLSGRTLEAELVERGPFPAAEVAAIGVELCHALTAVHEAGFIHRDVKTTNVMREKAGRIVLGDFGTGRLLDDADVDRAGLAGTPVSIAPEIFSHQPATPRSDIYSLGALLFRLATARYPIEGRSIAEIGRVHAAGGRTRVRAIRPELPRALADAIDRALDPAPDARFGNAREMAAALAPAIGRFKHGLAAAVTAIAIAIVAWSVWSVRREPSSIASGIVFTQIDPALQRRATIVAPFSDGRRAACRTRGRNAVQGVCNLVTGEIRQISEIGLSGNPAGMSAVSPDDSLVAYQWRDAKAAEWTLRIAATRGSQDREVYRTAQGFDIQTWAPDRSGVFITHGGSPGMRLILVPLSGPAREIRRIPGGRLSPDGRSVVVSRRVGDNRDLFVTDLASGRETVIAPHPADDANPVWTPDSRAVVFLSTRDGELAFHLAPVDGEASKTARFLHRTGRLEITMLGFSASGTLFVRANSPWEEVFIAPIDFAARSIGPPVPVMERSMDESGGAHWNPNGRQLAFTARAMGGIGGPAGRVVILDRELNRREEIALPTGVPRGSRARWLPDGNRIAVSSVEGSTAVVDLIDVRTRESRRIMHGQGSNIRTDRRTNTVYVMQVIDAGRQEAVLKKYDVRTGALKPVPIKPIGPTFDVSSDGSDFVMYATRKRDPPEMVIRIFCGDGATLDRLLPECGASALTWSHDGRHLLVACMPDIEQPIQIWFVPIESGENSMVELSVARIIDMAVHPNGRELTFTAGNPPPQFYTLSGIRW